VTVHGKGRAETGERGEEPAVAAWRMMRALVLDHERRKEACAALDLSFLKLKALRYVASEPMTMRELAARLTTDAPYATLLVDDLEERGLLERVCHPRDRRAKIVRTTAQGKAAARAADEILSVPPAGLSALGKEDAAQLVRVLRLVEQRA
jgi:DNA-binding MarR family transcriptional regulator